MEGPMRTTILDDDPLARLRLREFLAREPDIELVGEYGSGAAFLRELAAVRPELVFIDVEMPALSGFDVLETMRATAAIRPYVVFVTAFESYAVRAFDTEATDYLLKPFDLARFTRMLNRVRRQLGARDPKVTRVAVRSGARIQFVRLDQVDWIEAAANYVRLHIGAVSHLFRGSMVALERRLDPSRFVRIHRSTIVNVDRITELQPSFAREHIVVLRDGTRLRLSPTYRERLGALVDGL
jgi:two-component system LytT family response regulator